MMHFSVFTASIMFCLLHLPFLFRVSKFFLMPPPPGKRPPCLSNLFRRSFPKTRSVIRYLFSLESGVDDLVGLEGGDHDVEEPEADEDAGRDRLDGLGAAELAAHRRVAPEQQDEDGDQGLGTEHSHGEAQAEKGKQGGQSLNKVSDTDSQLEASRTT